jgi:hypothetical protein
MALDKWVARLPSCRLTRDGHRAGQGTALERLRTFQRDRLEGGDGSVGGSTGCEGVAGDASENASSRPIGEDSGDPDLALVVQAWAGLPAALRAGMVAMIRAAGATAAGRDSTS